MSSLASATVISLLVAENAVPRAVNFSTSERLCSLMNFFWSACGSWTEEEDEGDGVTGTTNSGPPGVTGVEPREEEVEAGRAVAAAAAEVSDTRVIAV